jgi:hypothetical protein
MLPSVAKAKPGWNQVQQRIGGMAERLKAPVLKTGDP